ncbi:hypothetical protein KP003_14360 [Geomonas nitrogeniifigens]|uniref:hypothetical protein n=1 Tax=Geomonas diazotrophica TaxID=2843197 RepID=UPI001C2B851F|nr:hypothetical protein [Geomonas nitrogeniifigens]QXE85560.1 hypothetical protein KP003_14360 [Geomonas nitrogeniifigens]
MLESLGVQRFSSSSKAVFKNVKATHFLERVVAGKVKPDIVSLGEYSAGGERDVFAWEIFVTHEVEEEKANQLRVNGIPYIELSPIEDGASTYLYTMKSYGGISFIDDDTIFNETIFRDNKADILAAFKNNMNEEILKEKLEDARQSWKAAAAKTMQRGLERQIMLKVKDMTPADVIAFAQAMSTAPLVIVPITSAPPDGNSTSDDNWVKVQTVSCEKHNQNYFVKVNDRHYFLSGLGMLRGLYAGLARMGILLGVTARNERLNETVLVGAKLTLPLLERKVFAVCSSLLYQYADAPTVEVFIWETRSIKSKTTGRHHMLVNDGILVDSYEWQLKNILYHLLRFTTVEAHLGLNTEGRPRVDALKIWGLMDVERMKEAILAAMNLSSR